MNDMMPTIEETATADIQAQLEHQEWERGQEQRERWEFLEATQGPLFTPREWSEHCEDYEHWLTYGVSPMAEMDWNLNEA